MKLRLQNYAVIMLNEKCCIKYINKSSSLQNYDSVQNYKILHRVVQRLSQHNLKISHRCHI
jgi:hypothetical protein